MSRSLSSWSVRGVLCGAVLAGALVGTPATAAESEPALVHATEQNACKLNVRSGPGLTHSILTTLTCHNYTTCVHSAADAEGASPCGPLLTGGEYSCVGADGKQVVDNRWAEVAWRTPKPSYVAVACAAFRG
ncbi:hypothetical protein SAMN05216266_101415 [Amycolatopsis marina]|uniref:Subtilisin inhibitor-like n=1 Tax=Amycolatopsis marina TaxID=490629 RepID=A0A1I0VQD5_9PSEU|nr:hypothetical protein [Amycolatopsis marina]SFA78531.1 hypothetical protein SAMN05216266_101415 [Amycolatopsis marina]